MKIVIDKRERALYELCESYLPSFPHITLETQVLPLGDILFCTDDGAFIMLFERKTYADLLASIRDGRYEEQSHRLQNDERFPVKHDIVYLIEGVASQMRPLDKKLFVSTFTSIQYFKGFSVVRTTSIADTAETLMFTADKLHRDFSKGKNRQPQSVNYCDVTKNEKKKNITKENIGELMLCQIPGISSTTAVALMKLGTLPELMKIIQESPELLDDLKIGDRKIGKNVVAVLKEFFSK